MTTFVWQHPPDLANREVYWSIGCNRCDDLDGVEYADADAAYEAADRHEHEAHPPGNGDDG
jgi:hypothetical protein